MKRSRKNTVIVGLLATVGLLVWAVIVDLGVHAGRIHQGVWAGGVDVGGMTEVDAFRALTDRGEILLAHAKIFTAENVQCDFYPEELGWGPQVSSTVDEAYSIGRVGGPVSALWARANAWVKGHQVKWAGQADPRKVGRFVANCVMEAEGVGVTINRARLRFRVRVAMTTYPKGIFKIPLEDV
ncbi:MAG: hypothetical protein ACR2L3_00820 [Actinomycetota bacterium]